MLRSRGNSGCNLWLIMENGKAHILGVYVMAQYVFFARAKFCCISSYLPGLINLISYFDNSPVREIVIWILFLTFLPTLAFLIRKITVGRRTWTTMIVLAIMLSFLFSYVSVSNVWTPHPLNDDVQYRQNSSGEYGGTFPWAQFSYPFTLTVFHTPFQQLTFDQDYHYGKAQFTVAFAGANLIQVNGNYSYHGWIMGPVPLDYEIDSVFSDSPEFFGFLVALFAFFNSLGAIAGIILAKALSRRLKT